MESPFGLLLLSFDSLIFFVSFLLDVSFSPVVSESGLGMALTAM